MTTNLAGPGPMQVTGGYAGGNSQHIDTTRCRACGRIGLAFPAGRQSPRLSGAA